MSLDSLSKKKRIAVNGVVLLDKPAGLSSNDALNRVKRKFNAKKAGHTGTLDPFATGLLPLCFGEATKFAQDLLDADKTYETVIHLGIQTLTGDTEGELIDQQKIDHIKEKEIKSVLSRFIGEMDQIPPMYSALKQNGRPLYEYARSGIELIRQARKITIHDIELLDFAPPFLTIRVACSKGTYIRVLGEDIGKALKSCAHLQSLRRIKVGPLDVEKAVSFFDIERENAPDEKGFMMPVDFLLSTFDAIELPDDLSRRFLHGQRISLFKENIAFDADAKRVRVYDAINQRLLGTAQIKDGHILAPERLIAG